MSRYPSDYAVALLVSLGLFMVVVGSGCSRDTQPVDIEAQRTAFLLAAEPVGLMGVAEAKETVKEAQDVAILGRISAGSDAPWSEGQAAFILSEVSAVVLDDETEAEHDHGGEGHGGEGHDPSTCPFCKKAEAAAVRAIVRFHDESGDVVPVDARQLFEVEKDQLVVVQGRGEVDESGNLIIAASGIFVRR